MKKKRKEEKKIANGRTIAKSFLDLLCKMCQFFLPDVIKQMCNTRQFLDGRFYPKNSSCSRSAAFDYFNALVCT